MDADERGFGKGRDVRGGRGEYDVCFVAELCRAGHFGFFLPAALGAFGQGGVYLGEICFLAKKIVGGLLQFAGRSDEEPFVSLDVNFFTGWLGKAQE